MQARAFERKYLFTGILVLKTGLHVGGGQMLGASCDAPVVRTPDGRPFIPGSSFKGVFRSIVEKLAPVVGLSTCLLDHSNVHVCCLSPQSSKLGEAFRLVRQYGNRIIRQEDQDAANALRSLGHADWVDGKKIDDQALLVLLDENLCDTCKLFGSPYVASRIFFSDLRPPEDDAMADKMIQVRDGVAIDRDSETAVDKLKYDYEVVAPSQIFQLEISLEDPTETDLALVCLGLSEFLSGFGYIGGHRSRGLGNCCIDTLNIYELDLTIDDTSKRVNRIKKYLLGKTPEEKMSLLPDGQAFLMEKIRTLPVFQEGSHA